MSFLRLNKQKMKKIVHSRQNTIRAYSLMQSFFSTLVILAATCFTSLSASPQAGISGTVSDANGAAISGALVELASTATGKPQTATTNANGEFRFDNLPGGAYRLTVRKSGFATLQREVTAEAAKLNLVLQVSAVTASVEIAAEAYLVSEGTTATKIGAPLRDIPQSVQAVNQNLLRDRATFTLAEAVTQNVAGVTRHTTDLTGSGAGDFLRLRGFSGSYNNSYLRDGQKFANYGATEMADIERVEVLKGASSVLYGRAEPGGVVNLVSKDPLRDHQVSFDFTGGRFNFFRPQVDATGRLFGTDKLLYRLNTAYQYEGNFRDVAPGKRVYVAPVLLWKPIEKLSINFQASYLHEVRGGDAGLVAVNGRPADVEISRNYGEPFNRAYQQNRNGGIRGRYDFNDKWYAQSAWRTQYFDYSLFMAFPAFFGGPAVAADGKTVIRDLAWTDYTERWNYSDSNVVGSFSTGKVRHNVVAGIEYGRQNGVYHHDFYLGFILGPFGFPTTDVYRQTPAISFDAAQQFIRSVQAFVFPSYFQLRVSATGAYAQDLITVTPKFKVLVGARFDHYKQRFFDEPTNTRTPLDNHRTNPRVGFVYQPHEAISLYASYGSSFVPQYPGAQTAVDSRVFKPSVGEQYEGGVKLNALNGKLTGTLALFHLTFSNLVVADPSNPGFSIQTGKQRSRGVELDVAANLWRGLNLTGNYAAMQATVTEDTNALLVGRLLPNTARHNGNLWATYRFEEASPLRGFGLGAGVQAVGKRFTNLAHDAILPAFARVDATAFYERNASDRTRLRFALNVQNLTNRRYYDSATPFGSFIFPGAPITVLGSFRITRR